MNKQQQQKLESGFRALNWIGIIEQLTRNLATKRLAALPVSFPQFSVLNHFSHRPDELKTVTSIADAMQQTQPAITKTVQGLLRMGYLQVKNDEMDRRVRWLKITQSGLDIRRTAINLLGPDIAAVFSSWKQSEINELFAMLDKLKMYLDDNRPYSSTGASSL